MGREVRRTPVGWVPPTIKVQQLVGPIDMSKGLVGAFFDRPIAEVETFQPQQNRTLAQAWVDYEAEKADWFARRDEIIARHGQEFFDEGVAEYENDDPTKASDGTDYTGYYRPDWSEAEMDGYQLYETVTEGTPLTPSFATKEELIDHLARWGQAWGEKDFEHAMNRDDAEGLVNMGSSPGSFMLIGNADGSTTMVDSENMVSSGVVNADGTPVRRGERHD